MSWNHRVIHSTSTQGDEIEDHHQIHEVYYDETGKIQGWTKNPVAPYGESLNDLRWTLDRMLEATRKPVLRQEGDNLVEDSQ